MTNTMPDIDIMIEDPRWQAVDLQGLAARCFAAVYENQGVDACFGISILACDDKRIAALNADFRDKPAPTNVLSWPAFDLAPEQDGGAPKPLPAAGFDAELGDIALSFDTCAQEAADGNIPFEQHLCHLLTHSCLHLLGYDHETDADAARMQGIETMLLVSMGMPDPY